MFGPPIDKNQPHPGGSLGAKNAPCSVHPLTQRFGVGHKVT
jgi:hypothetical protein